MIDRDSPLPIYFQLKQFLKQKLESGEFEVGAQLPTEQQLCAQYGVSRAPVRQALIELVQEGYIYRRAGQGTFVADRAVTKEENSVPFQLLANDMRWTSLLKRTVRRWNQEHPDYTIVLDVNMPLPEDFQRTLRSAAVQGKAPDMVSIDFVWLAGYAESGYLTSLDELDPAWSARLKADMELPIARQNHVQGCLYGLPMQADVTGLWYRRDWFRAAGLHAPATWEAWVDLLEYFAQPSIKARFGHQSSIAFPLGPKAREATFNLLLPVIWGGGGDLLDADGELALATPPVLRTLEFLQDLTLTRGFLPPGASLFPWWEPPRMLARGEVPMTLGGTYEWPVISEESGWETEDDLLRHLAFVPVPRLSETYPPATSLGGTSWSILRQSPLQKESLELMKLSLSTELFAPFYHSTLQMSPMRSINQELSASSLWLREILPLLRLARPRPMLGPYIQISLLLQQMLEMILAKGAPVAETVALTARYIALLLND
ncbi:MAG: extracellular solute-binding protein [Anaerolineae bacterium]|nr:extracellular solute-binding protein [Anaerolineae bacterium]